MHETLNPPPPPGRNEQYFCSQVSHGQNVKAEKNGCYDLM